jgi:hypothetical protein
MSIYAKGLTLAFVSSFFATGLSPDCAQLIQRKDLSYATALSIATGALEACKGRGYATSVVVLDRGGNVMVSLPRR